MVAPPADKPGDVDAIVTNTLLTRDLEGECNDAGRIAFIPPLVGPLKPVPALVCIGVGASVPESRSASFDSREFPDEFAAKPPCQKTCSFTAAAIRRCV